MRTDDEIRAAAERLRALPANYPWECVNLTSQAWADCRTLAHAYLNPWRPIDSAPRDGTRVLLGWDNGRESHIGWWGEKYSTYGASYGNSWGWGREWWTRFDTDPTHWMPLPESPPPLPPAPAA